MREIHKRIAQKCYDRLSARRDYIHPKRLVNHNVRSIVIKQNYFCRFTMAPTHTGTYGMMHPFDTGQSL
jgi:hypothetical protein